MKRCIMCSTPLAPSESTLCFQCNHKYGKQEQHIEDFLCLPEHPDYDKPAPFLSDKARDVVDLIKSHAKTPGMSENVRRLIEEVENL